MTWRLGLQSGLGWEQTGSLPTSVFAGHQEVTSHRSLSVSAPLHASTPWADQEICTSHSSSRPRAEVTAHGLVPP